MNIVTWPRSRAARRCLRRWPAGGGCCQAVRQAPWRWPATSRCPGKPVRSEDLLTGTGFAHKGPPSSSECEHPCVSTHCGIPRGAGAPLLHRIMSPTGINVEWRGVDSVLPSDARLPNDRTSSSLPNGGDRGWPPRRSGATTITLQRMRRGGAACDRLCRPADQCEAEIRLGSLPPRLTSMGRFPLRWRSETQAPISQQGESVSEGGSWPTMRIQSLGASGNLSYLYLN